MVCWESKQINHIKNIMLHHRTILTIAPSFQVFRRKRWRNAKMNFLSGSFTVGSIDTIIIFLKKDSFSRCLGHLLNILCTFSLGPLFRTVKLKILDFVRNISQLNYYPLKAPQCCFASFNHSKQVPEFSNFHVQILKPVSTVKTYFKVFVNHQRNCKLSLSNTFGIVILLLACLISSASLM